MAEQITTYQCPACTGPLHFGAESGNLECDYCGSSFTTEEVEAMFSQKEAQASQAEPPWDDSQLTENWGEEAAQMKAYRCPSCGAELLCQQTTAATACPYCGNPTVVPGQFSGALRPDFVLPFQIGKEEAIARLKAYYKGRPFLPRAFHSRHTIEKIQGVYVPFWLYDGKASGTYHYRAMKVRVFRQGDYEITETEHFRVQRSGEVAFEKVPVDASQKMPDDYMDAIEPFDYAALEPFSTAYLPGFLADTYDVSQEQSSQRVRRRLLNTLETSLAQTLEGYTTFTQDGPGHAKVEPGQVHYALLPVWLLSVKWKDEIYLYAVNGQTGKTAGQLPASPAQAWQFFAKLALPLSAASAAVVWLLAR